MYDSLNILCPHQSTKFRLRFSFIYQFYAKLEVLFQVLIYYHSKSIQYLWCKEVTHTLNFRFYSNSKVTSVSSLTSLSKCITKGVLYHQVYRQVIHRVQSKFLLDLTFILTLKIYVLYAAEKYYFHFSLNASPERAAIYHAPKNCDVALQGAGAVCAL